ncbi:MAG: hypothetical protein IT204_21735, partial [Fimbriimonadaceae bacterium]|nr:hypothetical protein [Fimbriimonadaceae bacterium]
MSPLLQSFAWLAGLPALLAAPAPPPAVVTIAERFSTPAGFDAEQIRDAAPVAQRVLAPGSAAGLALRRALGDARVDELGVALGSLDPSELRQHVAQLLNEALPAAGLASELAPPSPVESEVAIRGWLGALVAPAPEIRCIAGR